MEMRLVPAQCVHFLPNIVYCGSGYLASSKAFFNDWKFCWRSSHHSAEVYILHSIVHEVWLSCPQSSTSRSEGLYRLFPSKARLSGDSISNEFENLRKSRH